jgi:D-alanyl-D-alanine carboxypeptidase (penicillin-binding protein 5/6)
MSPVRRAALAIAAAFALAGALAPLATVAATVVPTPPAVDARAHLLVDFHSGRVLTESNADERLEPASLTKLLASYVLFAELREGKIALSDPVRISEKAWRMGGSRMFIEVDSRVSVEELLMGVIVQSGNDASVALAEHVAGDETAFADLMNRYAARIGMTASHFVNSSGLPHEDHYTTARDMAVVARALIRDFPELYRWYAIKEYEFNGIIQPNRNRLLWRDDSVDGLKTGYTKSAGYCLVASAQRDGMRLVSVVLGADNEKARTRFSQALLRYGFRFYETHRLYQAGEPIQETRIWQGAAEQLRLGVADDVFVTVPRGQYANLDARMDLPATILAPVGRGVAQGTLNVALGEEQLISRPLVALHDVDKGNLWRRISDRVLLMFE